MNTSSPGYSPGHPWFYVRGGVVQMPSAIIARVQASGYRGYRTEIDEADRLAEPARSRELRRIRSEVVGELRRDLSRYREVARALRAWRAGTGPAAIGPFDDVHTAMSLKYRHLYNDFAHLLRLEQLLARQRDLFDL